MPTRRGAARLPGRAKVEQQIRHGVKQPTQRHKEGPQGMELGLPIATEAIHTKYQVVSHEDPRLRRHSRPTTTGSQHGEEPSFQRSVDAFRSFRCQKVRLIDSSLEGPHNLGTGTDITP